MGDTVSWHGEPGALAVLEKGLGDHHQDLADPLKGIGLVELIRGRPMMALRPLERALAIRTQSIAANDPQELAEVRWVLTRALRLVGCEPTRARALAEAALAGYRSLGSKSNDRVEAITHWLVASDKLSSR